MLVLSRKVSQCLILTVGSDQIIVQVCGMDGNRVKIGIEAPDHVNILREELVGKDDNNNTSTEVSV